MTRRFQVVQPVGNFAAWNPLKLHLLVLAGLTAAVLALEAGLGAALPALEARGARRRLRFFSLCGAKPAELEP